MNIKGMDRNMQCRGFQFEVGKEYKIDTNGRPLELCSDTVFHYCKSLKNVHPYYDCRCEGNRFFEIDVLGEEVTDGEKYGSNHIRIVRELAEEELNNLKGLTDGNTGLFNSGNMNSGDMNSGNRNSGDRNSGVANKCNFSSGVFCNKDDDNIRIFNTPSGMSLHEFYGSEYWTAMSSVAFNLTEWIAYTTEEKAADPEKDKVGGYLKVYSMNEAWANWWNALSKKNKDIIMSMPNFNAEVFKDITGIDTYPRKKRDIASNWIISVSSSSEHDIFAEKTEKVFGTKAQVKKYLVNLVKADKAKYNAEAIDKWDHGTILIKDVSEGIYGTLHAHGYWKEVKKSYTATPEMEIVKL